MSKIFIILLFTSSLFSNQMYYEYGKKVELTPHKVNKSTSQNSKESDGFIRYYKKSNSMIVGVGNTIIAKCINKSECERVILKYNTMKFETISKNIYLIYLQNPQEIFEISVKLYEEGCFEYAHPNFHKEKRLR